MEPTQNAPSTQILPEDFVFSQSNLQTYTDCPRRFWFTYIQRLPWPAVQAGPVQEHEYLMRLGEAFHRAIQRTEIGIAAEQVQAQLEAPLDAWYADYLTYRPTYLPKAVVEVEAPLSIPLTIGDGGPTVALAGKFDLLAIEPQQRAVIIDWKTTRKRTSPTTLRQRLQSQVYPYLLVEASRNLPWGPLLPSQVEMHYWFTAAPDQPVQFVYDATQHAANGQLLQRLIAQILAGRTIEDFPLVPDTDANRARLCAYCAYRSRCDRGIVAGNVDDLDDLDDLLYDPTDALDFTLEDLPELAF
jgi:RecB family exonuclease